MIRSLVADLDAPPQCPVCRNLVTVYLLQTRFTDTADYLEAYVAICICGLRVPLTLTPREAGEACEHYVGVCATCGRPPAEHPDV